MPKNSAVATQTSSRNANTVQSNETSSTRGIRWAPNAIEQVARPSRDDDAGEAAGQREQQTLDHELPREPCARRAERRSRGDLLHPAARERQQQVRDVCARRDQHERNSAEEQPERSARRTEHGVGIGHDRRSFHPLRPASAIDGAPRRPRFLRCRHPAVAPGFSRATSRLKRPRKRAVLRDPHIDARFGHGAAQHRCGAIGKLKRLRHHAHDGERPIVERHAAADDIRIAAQTARATAAR